MLVIIGVDANEDKPEMLLSGDRNIVGGTQLAHGIVEITTNQMIGWSSEMHNGVGNVGMADGSVRQLRYGRLGDSAIWGENEVGIASDATNRLAIP